MSEKSLTSGYRQSPLNILLGIFIFGSIWGASEAALGGGLNAAGFPYRSALLVGIGMAIMGAALVIHRKPIMLLGIGALAMLIKLMAVPILSVPVMCKVNSCIAVLLEAVAFTLVGFVLLRQMDKNIYTRMGAGALAATLGAIGFFFIGIQVAPCNYLLSFSGNLGGFLTSEGLFWAASSAILLPLGWMAGEKVNRVTLPWLVERKPLCYLTSASIVILCWGMSAWVISLGF